ncbi:ribonuclease H-like domain-containing protein [Tanacetum coccineum]
MKLSMRKDCSIKFEVKDKSNAVTRLKNQLDETLREKDDLKAKLEQFETSSKNLNKLINSQISSKDKTGLGYGDQLNDSSGSELFNSFFDSRSSDGDDNQTNDRFKKDNGYHVIPPPLTGNYKPPLADLSFAGLDDSVYRHTANKTSASVSQVETSITPPSNTSIEMPRVKSVRPIGVIIEDWVSDDDEDNFQSSDVQTTVKPSFKKIEFTKARNEPVKSDKQVVKPRMVTQSPKRMPKESILGQVVYTVKGNGVTTVKASAGCVWRPKMTDLNNGSKDNSGLWISKRVNYIDPQGRLNGCSRHMTRNKALLTDYQDIDGGFVAFGGSTRGGKITGIGKIRTNKIDFEDVFFVKELKFNLFSVSQMCDKKNSVLFTETECLVLSPDFKLIDESQVLLRVPRQNNMYSFDLKNVVPSGDLTCLFAKATKSETSRILKKFITEVENQLNHKVKVIWSDNGTKFKNREMDEFCGQKGIKREYRVAITTQHNLDPEGKNDGKAEEGFLVGTPQQNKAAERKNRTLIEAARTMLADSLLPTVFWAEAVNTACYVLNRVLVTKPHNKTPYELIISRPPSISFMRPFGCPVTILNTLDPLGQRPNWLFDIDSLTNSMNYQPVTAGNQTNKNAGPQEANGDTGLNKSVDVGQSKEKNVSTQQYIVFPLWSSISSSYKSSDENDTADDSAGKSLVQKPANEEEQALRDTLDKMMNQEKEATKQSDARKEYEAASNRLLLQGKTTRASSTNSFNTVSTPVNTASASKTFSPIGPSSGPSFVPFGGSFPIDVANLPHDPLMPELGGYAKFRSERVEAIRLFLAFASFINFSVYRMDVKSAFLYGTIEEEVLDGSMGELITSWLQVQPDRGMDLLIKTTFQTVTSSASFTRKSTKEVSILVQVTFSWQCKSRLRWLTQLVKQKYMMLLTAESSALDPKSDVGLWFNFMQTKIHVDNESAICVVKNHVYHSKTKL